MLALDLLFNKLEYSSHVLVPVKAVEAEFCHPVWDAFLRLRRSLCFSQGGEASKIISAHLRKFHLERPGVVPLEAFCREELWQSRGIAAQLCQCDPKASERSRPAAHFGMPQRSGAPSRQREWQRGHWPGLKVVLLLRGFLRNPRSSPEVLQQVAFI